MILNDSQIKYRCETEDMIAPFLPVPEEDGVLSYGLSSFGYDVRIGNKLRKYNKDRIDYLDPKAGVYSGDYSDEERDDIFILEPHGFYLASTIEYFRIPKDLMCICVGKSTYARLGIIINVTPIEPGFEGNITIEISNTNTVPVFLYANEGIGQFLFFQGKQPMRTYADKKGKYQGQKGITMTRMK